MNHRKINHLSSTELSAVETYEQAPRRKGNAGRLSAKPGLIEDPIDKRGPGENTDWARAWRSFQSWGPY